ncbi:MAG TPA: hypothetical protein PLN85_04895 [archaeon]|nr:hypothetical protein [archaeon]HRT02537.1 hypothetical protein [Candidatus Diapherotrites archaeon]
MVKEKQKEEQNAKPNEKRIVLNREQTISLYQAKEKELNQILNKLRELDSLSLEMAQAENALKDIEKMKDDNTNILVNIGAGILIDSMVLNKKSAKITLPGGVMIDKDISKILKDIDQRKHEIEGLRKKLIEEYNKTINLLKAVSSAFEKLNPSSQKKSAPSSRTV